MSKKISNRVYSSVAMATFIMGGIAMLPSDPDVQPITISSAAPSSMASPMEEGKNLSFDRKKGNCLACHMIPGGLAPGNIGPPLIAMKARFPDRAKLKAQIVDPLKANPESSMLPFGTHGILSKDEIEKVVDFIWSL